LALKYHPAEARVTTKPEEKFKEASEAYEVLKDPQRDRFMTSSVTKD